MNTISLERAQVDAHPEDLMLDLTFAHVRELGLKPVTYAALFHHVRENSNG